MTIGTLAGLFSGLFGVGGGTVMVPLLVLWLGYGEREATGTSLAAIVLIAAFAAATQGVYGNVHVRDGLLVGVPAVGGVLLGTWLQQRLPVRAVSLLFAAVLVLTAIELLLR
ncbi:MAG TPA: sulfite exporter TauE/SafE family protein [Solirubrobacteraceae bacterium]|nr:sulfite exporter TauE/SafE family protein [Solirubrobacteraceae bacterium]